MNTRQLLAVVWEKSKLNLKSEAAVNYLSYLWWIMEPVLHMLVYYLVFDVLLQRGGPGFVFFLLAGLVPWLWFSKLLVQASNSLVTGRFLMGQIFIPKLFFPLVVIVQCSVKQAIVFIVLLLVLVIAGHQPSIQWLAIVPIALVQLMLMMPLAFIFAASVVFVRDLGFVIPTALQFVFFCSGIFFSIDHIAPQYTQWFYVNPMAGLVQQYREVLLNNNWPDWFYTAKVAAVSIVLWILSIRFYRNNECTITRFAQD
ncbi:MAG: ABC transporter permease [Pseudomonadota bacterium]